MMHDCQLEYVRCVLKMFFRFQMVIIYVLVLPNQV